jgi:hypothetical protein
MEQCLDFGWRLVPALLEGGFADVLGDGYIGGVQFAIADNADICYTGSLFANQLKD